MSANIWLTSDWHWRHENIYKFVYTDKFGVERRVRERFANAAEGDAYIEQKWRELVKPNDHVWHLGDLTMFRGKHEAAAFIALFRSLPGHKRLILGNHDHYDIGIYVEAGFEKIRGSHMMDGLLLTHYPVHPSSLPMRGIGNVHGHTHQREDEGSRYLNISVERTDYAPIALEEVKARFRSKVAGAAIEAHDHFIDTVIDPPGGR